MKRLRYDWSVILFSALLLTSCAFSGEKEAEFGGYEEPGAPTASRSEAMPAAEMQAADVMEDSVSGGDVPAQVDSESEDGETDRKRIYNGSAGLIVEDMENTRQDIESLTMESGGYVESSFSDYLVLRVPAEQFDEIFEAILEMGRVEYSRVETWDVTEAFADIERRLATAEETRHRLYILLEESNDPKERALILREIGRLTEEIESLKQQMSIMNARISFSRITVQLIPRIQGDLSRNDIPFGWIAYLDPLYPAGEKLRTKVSLDLGEQFAVFSREKVFLAEDSDGMQVIISTVPNSPRGDNNFWQRALAFHLEPFYSEMTEMKQNFGDEELLGVELVSKDREPFRYFVGIVSDGRYLHVVEIFSPLAAVRFKSIYASLERGELK